jgi:hypothetical protein
MAKQFLIVFFFLFSLKGRSQISSLQGEAPFLIHLDSLKAFKEKTAYLEQLKKNPHLQNNDTLKLELGHTYFSDNKFEMALVSFSSIKGFNEKDNFKKELGFCLLKEKLFDQYLERASHWTESDDSILIIQKLSAAVLANPEDQKARLNLRSHIPIQVLEENLKRKSPLLAGIYSALIPGTGKLYCKKKHQFFTSLLTNVAFGYQAYEAGRKDGINSSRFIITGILFSFFYIGNIWGSVLEARNYHIEQYQQFEHEVLDYNSILVHQ